MVLPTKSIRLTRSEWASCGNRYGAKSCAARNVTRCNGAAIDRSFAANAAASAPSPTSPSRAFNTANE